MVLNSSSGPGWRRLRRRVVAACDRGFDHPLAVDAEMFCDLGGVGRAAQPLGELVAGSIHCV